MAIDLDSYNTVPERIAEFAEKYPLRFVGCARMTCSTFSG